MCVPLVADIKWFAEHHPSKCKYSEVLVRWAEQDPLLAQALTVNLTHMHLPDSAASDDQHVRGASATGSQLRGAFNA